MIALTLPDADEVWVRALADGIRRAAQVSGAAVAGGNITRGPVCLSLSVHGSLPAGTALLRSGARPGDGVYVSGEIGGAAFALKTGKLEAYAGLDHLDPAGRAYFAPAPPFHLADAIRTSASAAIDVSDGLLQDLGHLCKASGVGVDLKEKLIPVFAGMSVADAVNGSDDYVMCFTSPGFELPGVTRIGTVTAEPGIWIDGVAQNLTGYQHFNS